MSYRIKEIFYSVQGEGAHTGQPMVFVRFAGCNLWSGAESGRAHAGCQFCDTDFVGTDGPRGGVYTATALVEVVCSLFPVGVSHSDRWVLLTGGEPTLQYDARLQDELDRRGLTVALETNGTQRLRAHPHWVTVSPKTTRDLLAPGLEADEVKFVFPQPALDPEDFIDLGSGRLYIQPKAAPGEYNTATALQYVLEHPHWRLSLQTHKILGVP